MYISNIKIKCNLYGKGSILIFFKHIINKARLQFLNGQSQLCNGFSVEFWRQSAETIIGSKKWRENTWHHRLYQILGAAAADLRSSSSPSHSSPFLSSSSSSPSSLPIQTPTLALTLTQFDLNPTSLLLSNTSSSRSHSDLVQFETILLVQMTRKQ